MLGKDFSRKNIQPEELKDRIIFMSMFNDIDWKKYDENCISNAANKMVQLVFKSISALSRGILKQKKGEKYHTLQWRT